MDLPANGFRKMEAPSLDSLGTSTTLVQVLTEVEGRLVRCSSPPGSRPLPSNATLQVLIAA
jgi:hypothetical protein